MSKLLSTNMARLWRSKAFWLFVVFMLGIAVYAVLTAAFDPPAQNPVSFETLSFGYSQILGFCCAVFTSLFLGTEYSDGTIRNKIIVGHSRTKIYLANLTTVFVASLFMMATYIIGALVGFPFFGPWVNLPGCMVNFVASIFTTAAFSAIFTLIAMLCTNKTLSAITSILLFLGLSTFSGSVSSHLIRNFLPTGQAVWVVDSSQKFFALLSSVFITLLGSVLITMVVTGAGIILFKKKDLK